LIDLNGATYVTIDGSNTFLGTTEDLTISNTNTGGVALRFINGASNNGIKNNVLKSVSTGTNGIILFSTSSAATGNNSNLISNNDITMGATLPGYGVYNWVRQVR